MARKETVIYIIKLIAKIAVLALLSLAIIYLIKSDNGLLENGEQSSAEQKVDEAIKIFSSTDGMTIEESLRQIDGLQDIKVNEETGEYEVIVDGQEFLVISQELVPEDATNEVIQDNSVNTDSIEKTEDVQEGIIEEPEKSLINANEVTNND